MLLKGKVDVPRSADVVALAREFEEALKKVNMFVNVLASRAEFAIAYTPYRPEEIGRTQGAL